MGSSSGNSSSGGDDELLTPKIEMDESSQDRPISLVSLTRICIIDFSLIGRGLFLFSTHTYSML